MEEGNCMGERYLIYSMLNREVSISGTSISGMVEKIVRNIFNNMVELTIRGNRHFFHEPSAIKHQDDKVVFVYGDKSLYEDESDDTLFCQMQDSQVGENIDDVILRTTNPEIRTTKFTLGPKMPKRRKWSRRKDVRKRNDEFQRKLDRLSGKQSKEITSEKKIKSFIDSGINHLKKQPKCSKEENRPSKTTLKKKIKSPNDDYLDYLKTGQKK